MYCVGEYVSSLNVLCTYIDLEVSMTIEEQYEETLQAQQSVGKYIDLPELVALWDYILWDTPDDWKAQ